MKPEMKKLIIANLPYLLFVYLFGKLGQTYRLAAGADLSEKLLHLADGFSLAFESAAPSFHLFDLAVGVAGAVALRLMVYCKSKNAKKYRRGVEYGSARWGTAEDIKPYVDPAFENNIILTQTERLTMNSRTPTASHTDHSTPPCHAMQAGRGPCIYCRLSTMARKVSPRSAKFLKKSNDEHAGESVTVSPGCARRYAVSTAARKSGASTSGSFPGS